MHTKSVHRRHASSEVLLYSILHQMGRKIALFIESHWNCTVETSAACLLNIFHVLNQIQLNAYITNEIICMMGDRTPKYNIQEEQLYMIFEEEHNSPRQDTDPLIYMLAPMAHSIPCLRNIAFTFLLALRAIWTYSKNTNGESGKTICLFAQRFALSHLLDQ